jgi:DNA-binding transcriptional regulator GbsR (MarR family)
MTDKITLLPEQRFDQATVRDKFVDLMEDIARQEGMSPIAGRILGYLMMSDDAVAFADIASALSISRGSVSENTNFLEELGLIARCRIPGDRRDHFRYRDDAGEAIIERQRRRTTEVIEALDTIRRAYQMGALQRQRIAGMAAFFKATLAASEELIAEVQARQIAEFGATRTSFGPATPDRRRQPAPGRADQQAAPVGANRKETEAE